MEEVDVAPVDLRHELRPGVQLRLALLPVVVRAPVPDELLQLVQPRTLRPIGNRLPVGPPRCRYASAEIDEILFWNVHAEGSDLDPFPNCTGHSGLLTFTFSITLRESLLG